MPTTSSEKVTLDHLISEHDRKIGFLESTTKSLNDRLDSMTDDMHSMRTEFREGLSAIASEFRQSRVQDENARRPQYGLLISVIFGVATVGFGFTALITQPLRDGASSIAAKVESLHNEHSNTNLVVGELKTNARTNKEFIDLLFEREEKILDRQVDIVDRMSEIQGVQNYMKEHLRDVDGAGSRKWIGGKATDTVKQETP